MSIELTNEEKISIINSHKKNLSLNQYNVQLNIKEENSKANPDQNILSNLNNQLADLDKQNAALDAEIASLPATPTA
jgi:septal ring factor EnvC (AmiA/AmiB activator)